MLPHIFTSPATLPERYRGAIPGGNKLASKESRAQMPQCPYSFGVSFPQEAEQIPLVNLSDVPQRATSSSRGVHSWGMNMERRTSVSSLPHSTFHERNAILCWRMTFCLNPVTPAPPLVFPLEQARGEALDLVPQLAFAEFFLAQGLQAATLLSILLVCRYLSPETSFRYCLFSLLKRRGWYSVKHRSKASAMDKARAVLF